MSLVAEAIVHLPGRLPTVTHYCSLTGQFVNN